MPSLKSAKYPSREIDLVVLGWFDPPLKRIVNNKEQSYSTIALVVEAKKIRADDLHVVAITVTRDDEPENPFNQAQTGVMALRDCLKERGVTRPFFSAVAWLQLNRRSELREAETHPRYVGSDATFDDFLAATELKSSRPMQPREFIEKIVYSLVSEQAIKDVTLPMPSQSSPVSPAQIARVLPSVRPYFPPPSVTRSAPMPQRVAINDFAGSPWRTRVIAIAVVVFLGWSISTLFSRNVKSPTRPRNPIVKQKQLFKPDLRPRPESTITMRSVAASKASKLTRAALSTKERGNTKKADSLTNMSGL